MKKLYLTYFYTLGTMFFLIQAMDNSQSWQIGSNCAWRAQVPQSSFQSGDLQPFQKAQQDICIDVNKKMEELAKKYVHLLNLRHGKTIVTLNVNIISESVSADRANVEVTHE